MRYVILESHFMNMQFPRVVPVDIKNLPRHAFNRSKIGFSGFRGILIHLCPEFYFLFIQIALFNE
jgi:hypothetical protein